MMQILVIQKSIQPASTFWHRDAELVDRCVDLDFPHVAHLKNDGKLNGCWWKD